MAKRKTTKAIVSNQPSLSSSLLQSADKLVGNTSIDSVIDFSESYRGLDIRLYPAQKAILKMMWLEKLSDNLSENTIEIPDDFNEHVLYSFTEVQWVDYLYETKRCNFSASLYEAHRRDGKRYGEVILPIGRRGSKTVMIVSSAGYLVYNLYEKLEKDFFDYFSLIKTNPLYVTFVSNNKVNSAKPYSMLRTFINGSDFLSKYIYYDGSDKIILLSPTGYDMWMDGTYAEGEYQLIITHSVPSPQLRGDTNIFVALDEYCFLRDSSSTSKTKYLDEELYDATVPSTTTLVDPHTGQSWGMAAILSSVNGKNNHMFSLYESSFGDPHTLMFHLPSFYVNRNLPSDTLKSKYRKSKTAYKVETLSVFDVALSSWLAENWEDYEACIHSGKGNSISGSNGLKYFMGIDFGFVFDSTTVAIGHVQKGHTKDYLPKNKLAFKDTENGEDVVVLDALLVFSPTEEAPLDPYAVVDEIYTLCKFFNVKKAVYDQFSRVTIESILDRYGLVKSGKFEVMNATQSSNDMLANITLETILSHRLELVDSKALHTEFAGLVEIVKSGFTKVENSDPDVHDDSYDAISRMVYLCLTEGTRDALPSNAVQPRLSKITGSSGSGSLPSMQKSGAGSKANESLFKSRRMGSVRSRR